MLVSSTEANLHSNLLFLLADVMETLMMDTCSLMKKSGCTIRQEGKRNFNAAMAALRKMKGAVKTCSIETQIDYGNDSDHLYQLLKLILDRCGRDDKIFYDIYKMIEAKESKLQMTSLDSSVFDSIEQEEERKSRKYIRIACEVFGLKDIKQKSNKYAYYARLLVARSLSSSGIRDEVIAEKMGLSKKTVKRLVNTCEDELLSNREYLDLARDFYKRFYEEKDLTKDIA